MKNTIALSFVFLLILAIVLISCPQPDKIGVKDTTPHAVTYAGNNNTAGSVPVDSNTYISGQTVILPGNTGILAKTDNSFAGWNTAADGSGTSYLPGKTFSMGTADIVLYARWIPLKMISVPGVIFFTGTNDGASASVTSSFLIAETEVTYELWSAVYTWATDSDRGANIYYFANPGRLGNSYTGSIQQPVTTICWRDALVWCNAVTEWYNAMNGTTPPYNCVYTYGGVIRDSRASNATACDNAGIISGNKGFTLPSGLQWELATRFIADLNSDFDIMDTNEYYPGNYASGATASYTNVAPTQAVAWYEDNSTGTNPVKGKTPNALSIYDMSGNVSELCFNKSAHGGSWVESVEFLQVGYTWIDNSINAATTFGFVGFRLTKKP